KSRRSVRAARRHDLSVGRGRRGLEKRTWIRRDPHESARQVELADHRGELHPDARQAGEAAERGRGDEVFRLGVEKRTEDGGRARLRLVASATRRADRGCLEGADQGCCREAALELSTPAAVID